MQQPSFSGDTRNSNRYLINQQPQQPKLRSQMRSYAMVAPEAETQQRDSGCYEGMLSGYDKYFLWILN